MSPPFFWQILGDLGLIDCRVDEKVVVHSPGDVRWTSLPKDGRKRTQLLIRIVSIPYGQNRDVALVYFRLPEPTGGIFHVQISRSSRIPFCYSTLLCVPLFYSRWLSGTRYRTGSPQAFQLWRIGYLRLCLLASLNYL